jgi:hypothetical protein
MRNRDTIILEHLYEGMLLNEVKWDTEFSDTSKTCLSPEDVANALNRELERLKIPDTKRPPAPKNFPRISKGNIPIDQQGKIMIDTFKSQLLKMPKTIFDVGEKSEHTVDEDIMTVNTGIPALRAVLWDEDEENFYVINTCPGAGTCPVNCYAMNGFYIMNDGKNIKLVNRLQLMMNNPDIYKKMAYRELELFAFNANRDNKQLKIRWNDAGDFFSETYFMIAVEITKELLKRYNVESYAYTKIAKFYKMGIEAGMVMNFSEGAKEKEKKELGDLKNVKMSVILPQEVFKEFFIKKQRYFLKDETTGKTKFKSESGKELLKQKIINYYNTHPDPDYGYINNELSMDNLFYTDELPRTLGKPNEYNCIVLPGGDSDRPAQRRDVRFTILLEH